jgi:hypothetical protein
MTTIRRWTIAVSMASFFTVALTVIRHLTIGPWGGEWIQYVTGVPAYYLTLWCWRLFFGADYPSTGET